MRSPSKKLIVALCGVAILMASLIGGSAAAQSPGGNPLEQVLSLLQDPNFGLAEIKSEVRSIEEGVESLEQQLELVAADIAEIKTAVEGISIAEKLEVSVSVDENACLSLPVQCSGGDHNHDAPSPSNHNPVRVVALVTLNGEQVTGLTADNFEFGTPFVPAGAAGIAMCPSGGSGCSPDADLRGNGGLYMMWVHPGPVDANWRAGTYAGRLVVTDDEGRTGAAIVEIVIPAE